MYKAGGIIGLIAGVFGFFAALFTLFAGGLVHAFDNKNAGSDIIGLGWGGVLFSFLCIVFAAVVFSKPKGAGIGLIVCAVLGMFFGGTFVAICMVLAAIGGVLAVLDKTVKQVPNTVIADGATNNAPAVQKTASNASSMPQIDSKKWLKPLLAVCFALLLIVVFVNKHGSTGTSASGVLANDKISLDELAKKTPVSTKIYDFGVYAAIQDGEGSISDKKKYEALLKPGAIVQWQGLVADEAAKVTSEGYLIRQTGANGTVLDVYITPRNEQEKTFLENVSHGSSGSLLLSDMIAFKGVVNQGDGNAMLIIKPAVLVPVDNGRNEPKNMQQQVIEPVATTTEAAQTLTESQNTQQVDEPKTAVKGHQAFVYKPPSNVRSKPDGDVLCSIDEPTNIMVYGYAGSTYNGTREVKWYYTDACGSTGVIADSQFR